jgi:hypothetical protein
MTSLHPALEPGFVREFTLPFKHRLMTLLSHHFPANTSTSFFTICVPDPVDTSNLHVALVSVFSTNHTCPHYRARSLLSGPRGDNSYLILVLTNWAPSLLSGPRDECFTIFDSNHHTCPHQLGKLSFVRTSRRINSLI